MLIVISPVPSKKRSFAIMVGIKFSTSCYFMDFFKCALLTENGYFDHDMDALL